MVFESHSRLLTDISGNNVECDDYLPFGEQLSYSGCSNTATTHKFTGKERDAETGLDNFGARYNSSTLGRFMSPDEASFSSPLNPQSWNLYAYVNNNPLSLTDPTGHAPLRNPTYPQCEGACPYQHGSDLDPFGVGASAEAGHETEVAQDQMDTAQQLADEQLPTTETSNEVQQEAQAASDPLGGPTAAEDSDQQGSQQAASGEGSQANIARRNAIANKAEDILDTSALTQHDPYGTNECSRLVSDSITGAGATAQFSPADGPPRPPTAGEWANPSASIRGWRVLGPNERPAPGGVVTTFSYDSLNRLTQKSYSDGVTPTATFAYDAAAAGGVSLTNTVGRMIQSSVNTGGVESIYSYDAMGRVLKHYQNTPKDTWQLFQLSYGYDLAGDMNSLTDADGITITYGYNNAGQVTSVTSSLTDNGDPTALAQNLDYNPAGLRTQMTLGNGLTEARAYDNRLQPCRINVNAAIAALVHCSDGTPSGNILDLSAGFNYGSADNGTVVSWSAQGQSIFSRTYSYDFLNRLSSMSAAGDYTGCFGLQWSYDAYGNRASQSTTPNTGGSCPNFTASFSQSTNRMDNHSYDAAGNLLNDGTHSYSYDAENRLIQVDGTSGNCSTASACYTYDAEGRRVETNYGSYQIDQIYDEAGNITDQWYYNPNSFIWFYDHRVFIGRQLLATYGNGSVYFTHPDHLGSARMISDVHGNPYEWMDYFPFGEIAYHGGTYFTNSYFTGDTHDWESNLEHTQFRQYGSPMGRWTAADPLSGNPLDPQSLNRYSYASNSPLVLVDPQGSDAFILSPGGVGHPCSFDALLGEDACGDMCEANSGTPCDESGSGGAGIVVSLDLDLNIPNDAPLNESNGLPAGVFVPPVTPQSLLFGGQQCEFGPCFGNSWLDGSTVGSWLSHFGSLVCRAGFIGLGASMGGQIGMSLGAGGGALAGVEGGPPGMAGGAAVGGLAGGALGTIAGGLAGNMAANSLCPSAPLMSENVQHDYILDEARQMIAAGVANSICDALKKMYDAATGKKRLDIKATQKQKGCRGH